MPVDPFLEPMLATLPPMPDHIDDFDAWRAEGHAQSNAMMVQLAEAGPAVHSTEVVAIPVDGETIDLRIYRPDSAGPVPLHLFLHGGGWVAGTVHLDFVDATCRERAAGAQCVVIAVDYRKAPEHHYPTPLDDTQAALTWALEHAADLSIRPDLITLGGQSAGANIAAGLALRLRDQGGPKIAFQLLEVPALDMTMSQPSIKTLGTGYGLFADDMERLVQWYLGPDGDRTDPYASPLLAPDLSGLPATHVMVSEYDPLRDDGEAFVARLREAGVPATFTLGLGHIHGSSSFTKVMASARAWQSEAQAVLRRAHRLDDPDANRH